MIEEKVMGTWEDEEHGSELLYHPLEGDDEFMAERRYATIERHVKDLDTDLVYYRWEVGVVYFYPIEVESGEEYELDDAKAKAEAVFIDKLVNNFEETFAKVIK